MISTIYKQLGEAFRTLNPHIQERFIHDPVEGEVIAYQGTMHIIWRSRLGWLFAHFTRIIGNPLSPYRGNEVPMDVLLFKKKGEDGICWQRIYYYPDKKPYIVSSIKKESTDGKMMECVGGGFGMFLTLYAKDTQLHFESYRYFWRFAGITVPLPHCITPGKTHVIHSDLGDGNFRFTLTMQHSYLGRTFFQDGTFRTR